MYLVFLLLIVEICSNGRRSRSSRNIRVRGFVGRNEVVNMLVVGAGAGLAPGVRGQGWP